MADRLYEQYERLYLQQAELCEENAVAGVRAAFGGFSRRYLQIWRSVPQMAASSTGNLSSNNQPQQLARAQEKIDAARDFAQRQLATALANGLGAIANLPPPSFADFASEPTVSGTSNQAANSEQEADNPDNNSVSIKSEDLSECECESDCENVHSVEIEIKQEIEDQTEMDMRAGTSITTSNIDNVPVHTEIMSSSSDSVSNNEVEFTGNSTDEAMRQSECAQVNMEEEQTRDLSGIINFVAINLPRPLVSYELSDEEDDNEREINAADSFDGHLPSMNNSANSLIASTSTGRYQQSRNKVKVKYAELISSVITQELSVDTENLAMTGIRQGKPKVSSSGTAKKGRQPASEAPSTVGSTVPEKHFKLITKRLSCPQAGCPKVCKDKKNLDVHLKAKHAIEQYRCLVSKCKRSFKYRSLLDDHLCDGHGKRSNWPCGLCSKTFVSYEILQNHHFKQHEDGLFECSVDDCNFKATNRRSVYKHHETHRTPKHTCPVANCGRSFVQKGDLEYHIRFHKERIFACGQCDKAFAQASTLYAHLRVHRGLMTARCTWPNCSFQAISPGNVALHVRTAHYKLPKTLKKQAQLGINDARNAYDFLEKI